MKGGFGRAVNDTYTSGRDNTDETAADDLRPMPVPLSFQE